MRQRWKVYHFTIMGNTQEPHHGAHFFTSAYGYPLILEVFIKAVIPLLPRAFSDTPHLRIINPSLQELNELIEARRGDQLPLATKLAFHRIIDRHVLVFVLLGCVLLLVIFIFPNQILDVGALIQVTGHTSLRGRYGDFLLG